MNIKTKFIRYMLGIASLLMASQVNANTIQVNPASTTVGVGGNFDLTVAGSFTDFTKGGSFSLSWDTSLLTLTTTEPQLVGNLDPMGLFEIANVLIYDPTGGNIDITVATIFNPAVTGNFDIATLNFLALDTGITAASIEVAGLNWVDEFRIDLDPQPNYVHADISIVPVPAAVWLFGSGLLGLVGIARRRNLQFA